MCPAVRCSAELGGTTSIATVHDADVLMVRLAISGSLEVIALEVIM